VKTIKNLTAEILGNSLVQSMLSYCGFRLLESHQANKYLANVMLWFAVAALFAWILEKGFGIKPPFFNLGKTVGKIFKPVRQTTKFDNLDGIQKTFDLTLDESKKLLDYFRKKKGLINFMKKFFKWLYVNKVTLTGFFLFVLFGLDKVFKWSDKWALADEWYYSILAVIFLIVGYAIKGRGLEGLGWVEKIWKLIDDFKAEKAKVKADEKKIKDFIKTNKFRAKAGLEPLTAPEHKPDNPPEYTGGETGAGVRPLTKEELAARISRDNRMR